MLLCNCFQIDCDSPPAAGTRHQALQAGPLFPSHKNPAAWVEALVWACTGRWEHLVLSAALKSDRSMSTLISLSRCLVHYHSLRC